MNDKNDKIFAFRTYLNPTREYTVLNNTIGEKTGTNVLLYPFTAILPDGPRFSSISSMMADNKTWSEKKM